MVITRNQGDRGNRVCGTDVSDETVSAELRRMVTSAEEPRLEVVITEPISERGDEVWCSGERGRTAV